MRTLQTNMQNNGDVENKGEEWTWSPLQRFMIERGDYECEISFRRTS